MAEVIKPILLDSTGQQIVSQLANVSTLLGVKNDALDNINTALTSQNEVLNNANSTIESQNTTLNALNNALAGNGTLAVSAVKSIQKGTVTISTSSTTITISEVNPDKCLVLFDGLAAYYNSSSSTSGYSIWYPYLYSITSTTLIIGRTGINSSAATDSTVSWQIIEFY